MRIVVGLPAGGAADVVVRLMGEQMEKSIGQPVVVENKPGGLYQLAVQSALSAPADGYTLLYVNSSFVAVQAVQKRFDLLKDFQPLIKTGETLGVLVVNPKSQFKTIGELVSYGRANPGKLTYGTLGVGSYEHLSQLALERAAGFRGLPVPYKGGPETVNAVMAGEIDFTLINVFTAMQFVPAGKLRPLAVRNSERIHSLPGVPTLDEAGIKLPLGRLWSGFVVRAGTPLPIAERLRQEIAGALNSPSVAQAIEATGLVRSLSKSPDEFRRLIEGDLAAMTELARLFDASKR
ncbi:tripartite tricarboxylate transporter substrate binding protein [Cupriavidus basilensis]